MLVKVTAVIETIVQIKNDTSPTNACDKAKEIIMEGNFGCLQADLQACDLGDVGLVATPITKKEQLSFQDVDQYAWEEDGGTTDQTCGEILQTKLDI